MLSAPVPKARGVLFAFVVAAIVAVLGPLISYRSDEAQLRSWLKQRVDLLARADAEALAQRLDVMEAELTLIADRLEIDPSAMDPGSPPKNLPRFRSALFGGGLLLVDANGEPIWSDHTAETLKARSYRNSHWFQTMLARKAPIAEIMREFGQTILVAVPVKRFGQIRGALLGMLDAQKEVLPGASAQHTGTTILVLDTAGDLLIPANPPAWAQGPNFRRRVEDQLKRTASSLELTPNEDVIAAAPVQDTGIKVALVADEAPLLTPLRTRFLQQLVFIAAVQLGAVLLLALYLRQVYRRSVETQNLAALGEASALIAHEIKNAINGLSLAASLLDEGKEEDELVFKSLRGQADRLKHLAQSLLQFGKPTEAVLVRTPLAPIVRECVEALGTIPEAEDVEMKLVLDESLSAPCDRLLLVTALDNLVRNALEAGAVEKDLGRQTKPQVKVMLAEEAGRAVISVEDNAGGPPADLVLFKPFTTGKPKGIGLGLLMARQAINAQDGTLDFFRIPQGSRFTVKLPLA